MSECPKVFPNDLPSTLPERETHFGIDLPADINFISILLYRMAPTKLKELEDPLKDFLGKGFRRPRISPWAAPVLYVYKKDEPLNVYKLSSTQQCYH